MPSAVLGTVRSLERDSNACTIARAGDNVAVTLNGVDASHVMAGGVLCHPDFPIAVAKHLELKVLVLEGANPILVGSQVGTMRKISHCLFHVEKIKIQLSFLTCAVRVSYSPCQGACQSFKTIVST